MKDDNIQALSVLTAGIVATVIALAWSAVWSGLTLSIIWGWFIVQTFSAPDLSILQAYGVCLVAVAVKAANTTKKDGDGFMQVVIKSFFQAPLACGLTLACGWVAKSMM